MVQITGHAIPAIWYVYPEGIFSFHVAEYEDGENVVFRVDNKTWPSSAVKDGYRLLRNALEVEVESWHEAHAVPMGNKKVV